MPVFDFLQYMKEWRGDKEGVGAHGALSSAPFPAALLPSSIIDPQGRAWTDVAGGVVHGGGGGGCGKGGQSARRVPPPRLYSCSALRRVAHWSRVQVVAVVASGGGR